MKPGITFIVSAYERPWALECCLASLREQSPNTTLIVTDNDPERRHEGICTHFGALHISTSTVSPFTCYGAANFAVEIYARREYLCFPSDDSYYTPDFAGSMLRGATDYNLDLVYCDMLDRRIRGYYSVFPVLPRLGHIDKTGFLIRAELFRRLGGFQHRPDPFSDGDLIERAVTGGATHAKVPGVMVVHS
jgi:hypothetical protein